MFYWPLSCQQNSPDGYGEIMLKALQNLLQTWNWNIGICSVAFHSCAVGFGSEVFGNDVMLKPLCLTQCRPYEAELL